jgi:hypothetical protein
VDKKAFAKGRRGRPHPRPPAPPPTGVGEGCSAHVCEPGCSGRATRR